MVNENTRLIKEQTRDGDEAEVEKPFDLWNPETYTKEVTTGGSRTL